MRTRALLLAAVLAACGDDPDPWASRDIAFPERFLFGAATAGFQVDMGCPTLPAQECEDPNSDWYQFVTSQEMIDDPTTNLAGHHPRLGPGQWELYESDFDLAASELRNGAHRLGIEWSRVFPTATDGIEGYEALRAAASARALTLSCPTRSTGRGWRSSNPSPVNASRCWDGATMWRCTTSASSRHAQRLRVACWPLAPGRRRGHRGMVTAVGRCVLCTGADFASRRTG
jgi:hypothetical protein